VTLASLGFTAEPSLLAEFITAIAALTGTVAEQALALDFTDNQDLFFLSTTSIASAMDYQQGSEFIKVSTPEAATLGDSSSTQWTKAASGVGQAIAADAPSTTAASLVSSSEHVTASSAQASTYITSALIVEPGSSLDIPVGSMFLPVESLSVVVANDIRSTTITLAVSAIESVLSVDTLSTLGLFNAGASDTLQASDQSDSTANIVALFNDEAGAFDKINLVEHVQTVEGASLIESILVDKTLFAAIQEASASATLSDYVVINWQNSTLLKEVKANVVSVNPIQSSSSAKVTTHPVVAKTAKISSISVSTTKTISSGGSIGGKKITLS
jgi:hypothetical protein